MTLRHDEDVATRAPCRTSTAEPTCTLPSIRKRLGAETRACSKRHINRKDIPSRDAYETREVQSSVGERWGVAHRTACPDKLRPLAIDPATRPSFEEPIRESGFYSEESELDPIFARTGMPTG